MAPSSTLSRTNGTSAPCSPTSLSPLFSTKPLRSSAPPTKPSPPSPDIPPQPYRFLLNSILDQAAFTRRHSSTRKPCRNSSGGTEQAMSSPASTQTIDLLNYIGGAWQKSSATEFVNVTNPATAELLGRTPVSTKADVEAAVQAAAAAFPAWRRTPPGERIQYLFKLKVLLDEHIDELARIITVENGKTFPEAKAELRRGIENVEVACGIPTMMQGYNLEDITPGVDETLIRQPLGVVAAIVPFNFPAMISYWFLPYAIACGNTFVLKPSERVPLSMCRA